MKNTWFIINPTSGTSPKNGIEKLIAKQWPREAGGTEVYFTKAPGHATKIAREAKKKGIEQVVAVGGDGTVNETAKALIGSDVILGIIPQGSGNGLARSLQLSLKPKQALQTIYNGTTKAIDVGFVNDHPFLCTSGTGFDAQVSHRFGETKRGFWGYVRLALEEYRNYEPGQYRLELDGETLETSAFMATVANAGQFGNNTYISPEAKMDDGLLDVCLVKPFPRWKGPEMAIKAFSRTVHKSPYMKIIRGKELILERTDTQAPMLHLDGEPITASTQLHYTISPKALKVRISSISA